jgi:hypothetical protein
MAALNRAVFCLECGTLIAEANIAAHLAANPGHALVRLHHAQAAPALPIGTPVVASTIMIFANDNPNGVTTGYAGQHYHDNITGITYICTLDGNADWEVV